MVPSMSESDHGINARFTRRGAYSRDFGNTESADSINFQSFSMDGRENVPDSLRYGFDASLYLDCNIKLYQNPFSVLQSSQRTTSKTAQTAAELLCVVCSQIEQFKSHPTKTSDITNNCWNPSGSSTFGAQKLCRPGQSGLCRTETWQYASKRGGRITSFWVGVERGCLDGQEISVTGNGLDHSGTLAVEGLKKFVRTYPATNTISKVMIIHQN